MPTHLCVLGSGVSGAQTPMPVVHFREKDFFQN